MENAQQLKGKVAVVTGGGGVLCGSMAEKLAECGMKVAVVNRTLSKAEKVVAGIVERGGEAIAVQCDVLDQAQVERADEEIFQKYGACDVLVNGAGGNDARAITTNEYFDSKDLDNDEVTTFFDLSAEGFRFVFDVNFLGSFVTSQVFARRMLGRGGSIINISSMSAPSPMTKVPAYSAAKAGIENFTKWLSVYLAEQNIRVNAIAPGFFLTEQNHKLLKNEDGSLTPRSEKIISQTPMRRFGKPEDLHGVMLWLANDLQSQFVTGITVPVDGGFMAYSGV
ncbi:SDR family oxidoreductase [Aureibacillus halotolerans]|uniref:NAD(P)-dependent dehydrogenase (Short-subunit alcohol dehydrogenase family) n=1 Tax=Aureibacillus halotolerans TaxID=1508390 RepID=A0A4R6TW50_9BACI|nr:SDR family oxidoreductase [Aureibacillus halotolerans]TDQ37466.1 NAD(P)-dependent dehydrogenase (short-subunit alcohol dehydrogenase family) [Aureibacillus halotolerans]